MITFYKWYAEAKDFPMSDRYFDQYRRRVLDRLVQIDRDVIPSTWWDTVIRHYYDLGYSTERTVQVILETMKKA